eukprot:m.238120 g.238120  ORF g.238120 m.238120 type:complete len:171 (+) comp21592_c0_seq1:51-563(+)
MSNPIVEERSARLYVGEKGVARVSDLIKVVPGMFGRVASWLKSNAGDVKFGPSLIRYTTTGVGGDTSNMEMHVGFFVSGPVSALPAEFVQYELPAGKYLVGTHKGCYSGLFEANRHFFDWAQEKNTAFDAQKSDDGSVCWAGRAEIYVESSETGQPDPAGWITELAVRLA